MKTLIAGASGFLGRHLCLRLKLSGHEIVALERRKDFLENTDRVAKWDGKTVDSWIEELETADILINLSGRNIACKWTEDNKKGIYDSRVATTQLLAEACKLTSVPPAIWINMSAIGIYQPNLEEELGEDGPCGKDFMGKLAQDWENALFEPDLPGTERVALRAAPVLGHGGGAFDVYVKLVRWFIGGSAGSGKQWMSWIHLEDLVRLFEWVIGDLGTKRPRDRGGVRIYNACAPGPARNAEFMAEFRRAYGRPWAPPAPAVAIKLFGELGGPDPSLALDGFRVVPRRATEEGFEFKFGDLRSALADLKGRN